MGSYRDNPNVVRELIHWGLFAFKEEEDERRSLTSFQASLPRIPGELPAILALHQIGAFAVPYLVDSHIAAYCACKDATARLFKPTLLVAPLVFVTNPPMAQKGVEYALQQRAQHPQDPEIQAACTDLIRATVAGYHPAEHAKLFPGVGRLE